VIAYVFYSLSATFALIGGAIDEDCLLSGKVVWEHDTDPIKQEKLSIKVFPRD